MQDHQRASGRVEGLRQKTLVCFFLVGMWNNFGEVDVFFANTLGRLFFIKLNLVIGCVCVCVFLVCSPVEQTMFVKIGFKSSSFGLMCGGRLLFCWRGDCSLRCLSTSFPVFSSDTFSWSSLG